jgi:transcriptional regulator with XRE-family HTH domain
VPPKTSTSRLDPIDAHVGSRVRLRRTLLGMSQEKLGHSVGLTFQQIQKYERGLNRIGSSRLFQFSRVLDVPVSFFFDDIQGDLANRKIDATRKPGAVEDDSLSRRETLELVRAYYRIGDRGLRRRVYELVKAMSGEETERSEEPPRA